MTTTRKLWIGFGTLTACSIVFGMAISAGLRSIQANVEIQANEARPRSAAARELEINALGYALAVRTFVQTDEPGLRTEAAEDAAAVELNLAEYERLARTERQREIATRFARLWQEYKVVGQGILDSQDRPLKR